MHTCMQWLGPALCRAQSRSSVRCRLQVRQLVLCGVQTPNCIRACAFDGVSLDYEVVVLSDATASKTEQIQAANLQGAPSMLDPQARIKLTACNRSPTSHSGGLSQGCVCCQSCQAQCRTMADC